MNQLKKDSVERYDEKIAWAKTQNPDGWVNEWTMKYEIGDGWDAGSCPYCIKYSISCSNGASRCPLKVISNCCNGLWCQMDESPTWKDWIYWAERVRIYILLRG